MLPRPAPAAEPHSSQQTGALWGWMSRPRRTEARNSVATAGERATGPWWCSSVGDTSWGGSFSTRKWVGESEEEGDMVVEQEGVAPIVVGRDGYRRLPMAGNRVNGGAYLRRAVRRAIGVIILEQRQ